MQKLLVSLIVLLIFQNINGQDTISSRYFVSVNTGAYFPSRNDFKTVYSSNVVFINGVSFGIPVINKTMHLYGKAMYFKKEGIPIIYHINIVDGEIQKYTTQEGKVTFTQFLFNIGMQKYYDFGDHHKINVVIGILLNISDEKYDKPEGNLSMKGFAGYLAGVGYEYDFINEHLSLFTEIQYNFNRLYLKSINISVGGLNINAGIRYNFETKL